MSRLTHPADNGRVKGTGRHQRQARWRRRKDQARRILAFRAERIARAGRKWLGSDPDRSQRASELLGRLRPGTSSESA
jgi:hypothetical protein